MSRQESTEKKLSITTKYHLGTLSVMDAALESYNVHCTLPPNDSINYDSVSKSISSHSETDYYYQTAIYFSALLICVVGAVGNGVVIWLLGFCIERTPFITYILNLAIADLGVLVTGIFFTLHDGLKFLVGFNVFSWVNFFLDMLTYSASLFLLTAISIDRCVAVFFPLWHKCRRPPRLPAIVCVLIWVVSFALTAVSFLLLSIRPESPVQKLYQLIVLAVLCLPLMTVATAALFIKTCFRSQQHRRGKLLTIILLTLLFFLLFGFPFNITRILLAYNHVPVYVNNCALVLSFLNSSVNPVIYFLVGRMRKSKRRESMKMILQKAFKEEEGSSEETPVESQL